ncbi:MAG: hypothetical protein P8P30_00435 [Rickettsiales bacterium]|nr:hypothetical protein [Rickettsiales bacterium]
MKRFLLLTIFAIVTTLYFSSCDSFKADPLVSASERLHEACEADGFLSWKACAEIEVVRGLQATRKHLLEEKAAGNCVPALVMKTYLSAAKSYCQNDDEKKLVERQVKDVPRC